MTFGSTVGNFRDRSMGLGSFCFLVTVVKPLSGMLGVATLAQELGAVVRPCSVGVRFP